MNPITISTLSSVDADAEHKLPNRIHLLRAGTFNTSKYGKLDISANDLKEMVNNFKAGHGRPGPEGAKGGLPVNFAHEKGGKAAAWINDIELDANNNLWGKVDWTGAGETEVKAGNWRYISSEFTPRCMGGTWSPAENSSQKIRNVLTGAATTNIPMFNGNNGIMASAESNGSDVEQTIYISASQEEKETKMPTLDEVRIKDATSLTKEEKQVIANALVNDELDAAEKKKFAPAFGIKASSEIETIEASAVTGNEGLVSIEASEVKTLRDRAETAEKKVEAAESAKSDLEKKVEAHSEQLATFRRNEVMASVQEQAERGAIVASEVDKWAGLIVDDEKMLDVLKAIPSNPTVAASNIGEDEKGQGGTDATTILDTKAKEIMASTEGMNYADALVQARRDNPELAKQDNAAVNGN